MKVQRILAAGALLAGTSLFVNAEPAQAFPPNQKVCNSKYSNTQVRVAIEKRDGSGYKYVDLVVDDCVYVDYRDRLEFVYPYGRSYWMRVDDGDYGSCKAGRTERFFSDWHSPIVVKTKTAACP